MKTLKALPLIAFGLLLSVSAIAQKAWIDDVDNFNPDDTAKIMVDIKLCDCQRLLGSTDPLYLWTWLPSDDATRQAGFENGEWTNSNPNMALTNEGNDIWSFKMVPTVFYGVEANDVYTKGFSFLLKGLDGTGDGGGGCDEDKTEDLMIMVDPPPSASSVLFGFPQVAQADDVFTIVYDNNLESKETMQNLADDDVFMFAAAIVDSTEYPVAPFFTIPNFPELQIQGDGAGVFRKTFIPDEFFEGIIPDGGVITGMRFSIRRRQYTGTSDSSDDQLNFTVGCE